MPMTYSLVSGNGDRQNGGVFALAFLSDVTIAGSMHGGMGHFSNFFLGIVSFYRRVAIGFPQTELQNYEN